MSDHRQPARKHAVPLAGGLLVAAVLAVTAVRCTSRAPSAEPAAAAEATRGEEPATAAGPPAAAEAAPPAARLEPTGAPDAGAPTNIGRLMRATDSHDRDLLAAIERKTHATPPATARELLELRRAGASRTELERFIHEELGGGVAVRLAAMQWLRAIHGEREPARDVGILSQPNTTDPSQRTVKPLTKKPER